MTDTIHGPAEELVELEALLDAKGGRITPSDVTEAAANPASALHRHFTWDDTEAAHKYRLQQAASVIRRFRIIRESQGRTITVPAFVRIPDDSGGYQRTTDIITNDLLVQRQRLRLIAAMERLAEQLRSWDEFAGVAEALTEAVAEAS